MGETMNSIINPGTTSGLSGTSEIEPAVSREQQAARDFEALFVSMMLKEMRKSVSGDGLFAGDASDTFGGMFDSFMGEHIAASGGIGLSRIFHSAGTASGGGSERTSMSVSAALEAARNQQAREAYSHGISLSGQ
ncbi:MAG: rod-binding protein [Planctomycetaceae bacterium]